eukprot:scaffold58694_cov72-Cyclotella_meneghiniana.AAC.10
MFSIESPPPSKIFHDASSPPPTPRKRIKVHNKEEVPFFFPISQSVFVSNEISSEVNDGAVDTMTSQFMSNLSTSMRLKPRPRFGTGIKFKPSLSTLNEVPDMSLYVKQQEQNRLEDMVDLIPPPPLTNSAPCNSLKSSKQGSYSSPKKTGARRKTEIDSIGQKLQPIQRMGMVKTMPRRNSAVAKSA